MPAILPGAVWVNNPRNAGGTYADGYPPRIVLHTIEGGLGTLSASLPASHAFPPHAWYDPSTRRLYQTVPLDRSAFALYQGAGPYTNKARALQVEIAGRAATAGDWPDEYLLNIARDVIVPFVEFVREQGSDINLDNVPAIGAIGGSASEYAPQRMSDAQWSAFDGVCSHRHVGSGNDHWDTGTMRVDKIVAYAKELLGTAGTADYREEDELNDVEKAQLARVAKVADTLDVSWAKWKFDDGRPVTHIMEALHFVLLRLEQAVARADQDRSAAGTGWQFPDGRKVTSLVEFIDLTMRLQMDQTDRVLAALEKLGDRAAPAAPTVDEIVAGLIERAKPAA